MPKSNLTTWRQIASNTIFEHPRLSVIEDTVELPSGKQVQWLRFPHGRDAVCIICLDHLQRVLVTYQYNHPPQCVVDEFPGGGVEEHESYEEAARRELLEETGWYAHQLRELGAFLVNNRRSSVRLRVFLATNLEERTAIPEDTEFIAMQWIPIAEMEQRISQGDIENGTLLAAWSIFRATLNS